MNDVMKLTRLLLVGLAPVWCACASPAPKEDRLPAETVTAAAAAPRCLATPVTAREPGLVSLPLGKDGSAVRVNTSSVRLVLDGAIPSVPATGLCEARLDWPRLASALDGAVPTRPLPTPGPTGSIAARVGSWEVNLRLGDFAELPGGLVDLQRPESRRSGFRRGPADGFFGASGPLLAALGVGEEEARCESRGMAAWERLEDGTVLPAEWGGSMLVVSRHFRGIPVRAQELYVELGADGMPVALFGHWTCIDPARVSLPARTATLEELARLGIEAAAAHLAPDLHGDPLVLETFFELVDPVDGVYGLRLKGSIAVPDAGPDRQLHGFDFDLP